MVVISNITGLSNNIIIDNIIIPESISNHGELVSFLIEKSDFVSITSPFIMQDFEDFFSSIDIRNIKFELITSCAPKGNEQLSKPFQIKNFAETIYNRTNKWPKIHLNQKLHSKIYIFYKNNHNFCTVVTSANFTKSGLVHNHETGLLVTDKELLAVLEYESKNSLEYVDLADFQINKLCETVEIKMNNTKRLGKQEDIDIGLENIIEKFCTPSAGNREVLLREGAKFFISVLGVKDRPLLPEHKRKFNSPHTDLGFAKEPKGMRLGDCLLEVAVGGKCFLSYYSVASQVYERTAEEKKENPDYIRWPYYVLANNLSLNYGEKWYENPIYYNDIIKDFKEKHPSLHVTPSGKDSINGAIGFGSSYFRITDEFATFVKEIIDKQ